MVMGHRTLKRVPLDFNWPLNTVWKGYVNLRPGPNDCHVCDGGGYHPDAIWVSGSFYRHSSPFVFDPRNDEIKAAFTGIFGGRSVGEVHACCSFPSEKTLRKYGPAFREFCVSMLDCDGSWNDKITQDEVQALVDQDRLMDFTHTCEHGEGWKRREDGYIPTAEEVNANQHPVGLGGHDAINRLILIESRLRRLGLPIYCPKCKGKGYIWVGKTRKKAQKRRKYHTAWKEHEPLVGDGYQLWETCSEGSPISPVFRTDEALAAWCAVNATIFAREYTTYKNWLEMFTGQKTPEVESMFVATSAGYVGAYANEPR